MLLFYNVPTINKIFLLLLLLLDEMWSFLDGHCYAVINDPVDSYDAAMESCVAYGGYVAATALPAEINEIHYLL